MVRSLLLTLTMLFGLSVVVLAQSQTVLTGKVTDLDNNEDLIGASVKVLKGTQMVRGTITDVSGDFRLSIDPGLYDLEISYTGYAQQQIKGVQVLTGQLNVVNVSMSSGIQINTIEIKDYKVPLIKADQTSGGKTLTSEQIKNLPTRSVNAIVATTAGVSSVDGGAINIKGSRSNGTNYFIDGIRVSGSPPPVQDIEQLAVITGGLGAEYGDVTGGIISVVTKGPASEYHGSAEIENSHGLDPYGWLLATANVSGPILKRKRADGSKTTLVGFRLSGQYNTQRDDDPPAQRLARAKGAFLGADKPYGSQFEEGSVMDNLQASPLKRVRGNVVSAAESFTNDSVDFLAYNPFENRRNIDITSKLDFRFTDNIDLSVTGTFQDQQNQFTPTGGGGFSDNNWRLVNAHNNPTQYDRRYRGIMRFRHRLGNSDKEAKNTNKISISNASYQIQAGFERGTGRVYDPRHGDNYFDYGYVGEFAFRTDPIFQFVQSTQSLTHVGNFDQFTGFTQGAQNPALAAYNEFANPEFFESFLARNGRFTTIYDDLWSGMHANTGIVYNRNRKTENDIVTISASSSFDIKLGRTGTHNIQFGILNEQRVDRSWDLNPFGLWEIARQLQNSHFNGVDASLVLRDTLINLPGLGPVPADIYGQLLAPSNDARFYREIRARRGLSLQDYVYTQGMRPEDLSLDMFSAFELTEVNGGLLNYSGYDYLGNRLENGVTFNDFFSSRDASGDRTFPVAPQRPLYQAAFIKDKFTFNKMIFSLGVRIERFDLNTKVMRDPYSLYEIMPANRYFSDFYNGARPATVGDDYKVYTKGGYADFSPVAFRNGDTWYDKNGNETDPNLIFGGGVIAPLLNDTITGDNIRSENFNPNSAFADYVPQVNVLPRLAFSFPISEDANFFAHYDVLVQRPPDSWQVTALNYYYFYTSGRTPGNNANLRPEKVVDYEVGFQQKLNQNSALKFSAYYRELRDMIQQRVIGFVPVIGRYGTAGNIDFGTVKGFTTQYDLRRVRNLEMQVAYTLQFADGTGSESASARGRRNQIRSLYPLDFDERHSINAIIDYRFDQGKFYTGPEIAGKQILALLGLNTQITAVSGRPYTPTLRPIRFGGEGSVGSINGNRLPWRFTIDMRLDKTFNLTPPKSRNPLNLNVYFRVSNLLNRKNQIGTYSYTGSATDDGYLISAEGQSIQNGVTEQGRNINAFRSSYAWALLNPDLFMLPRRMFVGASVNF
jgi:outer membrane receptor protein involved in Fe transport